MKIGYEDITRLVAFMSEGRAAVFPYRGKQRHSWCRDLVPFHMIDMGSNAIKSKYREEPMLWPPAQGIARAQALLEAPYMRQYDLRRNCDLPGPSWTLTVCEDTTSGKMIYRPFPAPFGDEEQACSDLLEGILRA